MNSVHHSFVNTMLLMLMLTTFDVDADPFQVGDDTFFSPYKIVQYQNKDEVPSSPGIEWTVRCSVKFVCCRDIKTGDAYYGCTHYGMRQQNPCNDDHVVHDDMTPCMDAQRNGKGKFEPNMRVREDGYPHCFTSDCKWVKKDLEDEVQLIFRSRAPDVGVEALLSYKGQWDTAEINDHAKYIETQKGHLKHSTIDIRSDSGFLTTMASGLASNFKMTSTTNGRFVDESFEFRFKKNK